MWCFGPSIEESFPLFDLREECMHVISLLLHLSHSKRFEDASSFFWFLRKWWEVRRTRRCSEWSEELLSVVVTFKMCMPVIFLLPSYFPSIFFLESPRLRKKLLFHLWVFCVVHLLSCLILLLFRSLLWSGMRMSLWQQSSLRHGLHPNQGEKSLCIWLPENRDRLWNLLLNLMSHACVDVVCVVCLRWLLLLLLGRRLRKQEIII
jgi:hypothetical protein